VSGLTVSDKVYDGKLAATIVTSGATLAGLVSGDKVSLDSAVAAFADKNVGVGKTVNITNVALGGADAANYTLTNDFGSAKGNITARPLANWIGTVGGSWSMASNWDALPDGVNVLAVSIPAGMTVTYDAGAGNTSLQSFSGAGGFSISGGSLSIGSGLGTTQYSQSGGSLSLAGAMNVNASFSQTGGTIAASGPVSITQNTCAPAISLSAPGGSIGQAGSFVTAGLLTTRSLGSTLLNQAGNHVSSFSASTTGAGDIALTNVGVIDVQGINAASGNVTVYNTGGISTSGKVVANGGKVSMTANSPLTIGSDGVTASGDIELIATNLTSSGNLTLNGDLVSSAGAVALSAANNLAQNSKVSAAQGISVSAGGTLTLGPAATSFGNPVSYSSHGAPAAAPPGSQASSGSAPTDYVAVFLTQFENTVVSQQAVSVERTVVTEKDKEKEKDKKGSTAEGEICLR
jgi:hypothetical protein